MIVAIRVRERSRFFKLNAKKHPWSRFIYGRWNSFSTSSKPHSCDTCTRTEPILQPQIEMQSCDRIVNPRSCLIHGRGPRARRRNFCSVISEFALPQVAHSQGPPPECSLLICRSLARTTRHARHVTHDTSRTARHGHAKFPVRGSSAPLLYHTPILRFVLIK